MTAKERFKELGYSVKEDTESITYTFTRGGFYLTAEINFDLVRKCYWTSCLGRASCVSILIHEAIHKQIKQLGWLNFDN